MSDDQRHVAGGLLEHRSMEANANEIVAFYNDCIRQGELWAMPDWRTTGLPGRCCPGFSAKGVRDHFIVNVYQRKHLAFWTVHLSHNRRRKSASARATQRHQPDGRSNTAQDPERRLRVLGADQSGSARTRFDVFFLRDGRERTA